MKDKFDDIRTRISKMISAAPSDIEDTDEFSILWKNKKKKLPIKNLPKLSLDRK